ncbi:MAG: hypothetical protein IPK55_14925 [Streptococcus sp.]|nr:hypothetical protein [Streptococcus sp.]
MSTKLQNIARKENWMLYHLKGMDSSINYNIITLSDLKNTSSIEERIEIEALQTNLKAIRSLIYFSMRNIKNLQNFRKEKK